MIQAPEFNGDPIDTQTLQTSVTLSSTLIDSGFKNVTQAPCSMRPYLLICCVCGARAGREATVCLH